MREYNKSKHLLINKTVKSFMDYINDGGADKVDDALLKLKLTQICNSQFLVLFNGKKGHSQGFLTELSLLQNENETVIPVFTNEFEYLKMVQEYGFKKKGTLYVMSLSEINDLSESLGINIMIDPADKSYILDSSMIELLFSSKNALM